MFSVVVLTRYTVAAKDVSSKYAVVLLFKKWRGSIGVMPDYHNRPGISSSPDKGTRCFFE